MCEIVRSIVIIFFIGAAIGLFATIFLLYYLYHAKQNEAFQQKGFSLLSLPQIQTEHKKRSA
jgi:heme/copper-type cytochrome/quinol oxidase subunit 3